MKYSSILFLIIIAQLTHPTLFYAMHIDAQIGGASGILAHVYLNKTNSCYYKQALKQSPPLASDISLPEAIITKNMRACICHLAKTNVHTWRNKKNKSTLLHIAATAGNDSFCEFILECGIINDLTIKNKKGETPFSCAMAHGHTKICQLFIEYNPNNPGWQGIWPVVGKIFIEKPQLLQEAAATKLEQLNAEFKQMPEDILKTLSTAFDWASIFSDFYSSKPGFLCSSELPPLFLDCYNSEEVQQFLRKLTLLPPGISIADSVIMFKFGTLGDIHASWLTNMEELRPKDINIFPLFMQHESPEKQIDIRRWQNAPEQSLRILADELLFLLPLYQMYRNRTNPGACTVCPINREYRKKIAITLLALCKFRRQSPLARISKDVIRHHIIRQLFPSIGKESTECVNQQMILLKELLCIVEARKDVNLPLDQLFDPNRAEQHLSAIIKNTREFMNLPDKQETA